MVDKSVVVIGGGPAGLTAAYQLSKENVDTVVLERDNKVGGISRTEVYKGFRFDMGGHRFFTKDGEVSKLWHEILGPEFLCRPRLSRIYYNHKFFHYPLKPANALRQLGAWQAILVGLSFIRWQILPYRQEDTFEEWVTNRFGKRLYEMFFKSYTEKVWGIPCTELRAEFAAQRIKDLSLKSAVLSMFVKPKQTITTLIEEFEYPRLGPGMMWETVASKIEEQKGKVLLDADVVKIHRTGNHIDDVVISHNGGGEQVVRGTHFISSMPLMEFMARLDPPAPTNGAPSQLKYRDFLTVCLIVNRRELFPDNWIYIHSPDVTVGRIQNFKNWSPDMVPDLSKSSVGMEYFCQEGDDLWNMADADLVEKARLELEHIGLARYTEVEDGCVFRVPKAYPIYDASYRDSLQEIKTFINGLDNLQPVGRAGLHRYNNQDHAMKTGMLAARNVALGEHNDVWSVNTDRQYQEEIKQEAPLPQVSDEAIRGALERAFPKMEPIAFGAAVGVAMGLILLLATMILVAKGGADMGANLYLLNQYFPGYEVSLGGSLLGGVYAFAAGFAAGWVFASLRNLALFVSVVILKRQVELELLRSLFY